MRVSGQGGAKRGRERVAMASTEATMANNKRQGIFPVRAGNGGVGCRAEAAVKGRAMRDSDERDTDETMGN